jgi:hypothetical protein
MTTPMNVLSNQSVHKENPLVLITGATGAADG